MICRKPKLSIHRMSDRNKITQIEILPKFCTILTTVVVGGDVGKAVVGDAVVGLLVGCRNQNCPIIASVTEIK